MIKIPALLLGAVLICGLTIQAVGQPSVAPEIVAATSGRLIYPAAGPPTRAGHNFVYRNVPTWEPDVFDFLDARLQR